LHLHFPVSKDFRPGVFLDRDGVLMEDQHLLTSPNDVRVFPDVPFALQRLKEAGLRLVVVSNQTVVARGLATEADVASVHRHLQTQILNAGGPILDGFYFCPHHPDADLEQYRQNCECRKPKPGLLLAAAREQHVDLKRSFLIGDRMSDIIAGDRAGCRTVWVQTGMHSAPPIVSDDPLLRIDPTFTCRDFTTAVDWILQII
jgi:D-glycero-D-manno-heptose 1,7-bisphosphate phosphatase